jgi:hypothetical protein
MALELTWKTGFKLFLAVWALGVVWTVITRPFERRDAAVGTVSPAVAAESPQSGPSQDPNPATAPSQTVTRVSANQMDFELVTATGEGADLVIEIRALNNGSDRNLDLPTHVYSHTTLTDDHGNNWKPSQIRIGNVTAGYGTGIRNTMVSGVPTPIVLTFNSMPTIRGVMETSRIARLDIPALFGLAADKYPDVFPWEQPGTVHLDFRNVEIQKSGQSAQASSVPAGSTNQ